MRLATLVNGVTSFSTVPLKLMVMFGMIVSFVSFAFGLFVILEKLISNSAAGWASLIVSIWLWRGHRVCLASSESMFHEYSSRPRIGPTSSSEESTSEPHHETEKIDPARAAYQTQGRPHWRNSRAFSAREKSRCPRRDQLSRLRPAS